MHFYLMKRTTLMNAFVARQSTKWIVIVRIKPDGGSSVLTIRGPNAWLELKGRQ